jgi:hypothetical protein
MPDGGHVEAAHRAAERAPFRWGPASSRGRRYAPSNFVTGGLALIVAAFASLRDNRDGRVCRCAPGRNGPAAPNHPPRLARVKKRIGLRGLADPYEAGSTHKNDLADVGLNSRLTGNTLRSRPKGER